MKTKVAISVKWFRMVELHTLPYSPDVNPVAFTEKKNHSRRRYELQSALGSVIVQWLQDVSKSLFNCTQLSVFWAWIVMED